MPRKNKPVMIKTDLVSSSKLSRAPSQHIIAATWASRTALGSLFRCMKINVRREVQFPVFCVGWGRCGTALRCSAGELNFLRGCQRHHAGADRIAGHPCAAISARPDANKSSRINLRKATSSSFPYILNPAQMPPSIAGRPSKYSWTMSLVMAPAMLNEMTLIMIAASHDRLEYSALQVLRPASQLAPDRNDESWQSGKPRKHAVGEPYTSGAGLSSGWVRP
jgi:hypothetical protein